MLLLSTLLGHLSMKYTQKCAKKSAWTLKSEWKLCIPEIWLRNKAFWAKRPQLITRSQVVLLTQWVQKSLNKIRDPYPESLLRHNANQGLEEKPSPGARIRQVPTGRKLGYDRKRSGRYTRKRRCSRALSVASTSTTVAELGRLPYWDATLHTLSRISEKETNQIGAP